MFKSIAIAMLRSVRASVVMMGLVLVACGGAGNPGLSGRDPRCPATPPANGAPCDFGSSGSLSCEYGGDALGRGTTSAQCAFSVGATASQWFVSVATVLPNPAACPASWSEAMQSGSCTSDVNLACEYDEGRCGCVCSNTTVSWACRARADVLNMPSNNGSTCPSTRPLAGDACSSEGTTCFYDKVCGDRPLSFGPALVCAHGYWEATVDTGASCGMLSCPGWTG
jgi:hypothetical protein